MDRTTIEDALFPDCPIRNILARISDKWSLLVIYTLDRSGGRAVRFKELQREIPDISQKMLTVTLRTLEEDGYVMRKIFRRMLRYAYLNGITQPFASLFVPQVIQLLRLFLVENSLRGTNPFSPYTPESN